MNDDNTRQAELAVIGAAILAPRITLENPIVAALRPGDFYNPAHGTIWQTITALHADNTPVDPVTIANELARTGDLARVGGHTALVDATAACTAPSTAPHYAKIVQEASALRRLSAVGARLTASVTQPGADPDTLTAAAVEDLLNTPRIHAAPTILVGDVIDDTINAIETPTTPGVATGLTEVDRRTNGLHPGQLIILAGRPASGKSTLAMDWVRNAAMHGQPSLFFSLEMPTNELVERLLAAQAGVRLSAIRTNTLTDAEWSRLWRASTRLKDAPLWIVDQASITPTQIRAIATSHQRTHGLRLVAVDYLQLMSTGTRSESRQQEVSGMSRALKLMAKDLGIPVIAASQLNRGPEGRADKRPMLSDLRESGSLEQDADVVILVYREDMYEKETPRAGEADLIIAKQRNGPTDTATVVFQGHYTRFANMAPDVRAAADAA